MHLTDKNIIRTDARQNTKHKYAAVFKKRASDATAATRSFAAYSSMFASPCVTGLSLAYGLACSTPILWAHTFT